MAIETTVRWVRRYDRPAWHPDDCDAHCCWRQALVPIGDGQSRDEGQDRPQAIGPERSRR